jgi:sugar phosphate isomerase/epimerase
MELGIFAKTFVRATVEETFDAVAAHGLRSVQFNLSCAGLPTLPDRIEPTLAQRIRQTAADRGIAIAAISGTFNLIHPDLRQRHDGLRRLAVLIDACPALGTSIVTLSTGTRDPDDMWRRHPDNDTPAAWRDVLTGLAAVLPAAEARGVTLAFEPERANVVDDAAKALALLRELGSPRLGVVIDPANLFDPGEEGRLPELLDEAFRLLGDRIVLAHAKDRAAGGSVRPAGSGIVPWRRYVELLGGTGFDGALAMHGLDEPDVPQAVRFLRGIMPAKAESGATSDQ